jgi:thiamine biosynthesis lipoprotein
LIKIYLPIFLLISFVFIISISFLYEEETVVENISGSVMGTTYSINLQIDNSANIESSIVNIFSKVNEEMSTYIEGSMISRVNKSVIGEWTSVNEDFIEVLAYATNLCLKTNGVYDVTIGKIVDSWGFGPEEVTEKPKKKLI